MAVAGIVADLGVVADVVGRADRASAETIVAEAALRRAELGTGPGSRKGPDPAEPAAESGFPENLDGAVCREMVAH